MITVKIGTKTTSAKDAAIRCGTEGLNASITLADDTTDIRTLKSEFEAAFDGTITLPDATVISSLELSDVVRNYSEDGTRTMVYLTSVSNAE